MKSDPEIRRYPERVAFRAPRGLPAALEFVARQRNTSPSEWLRSVLLRGLAEDGVGLRNGLPVVRREDEHA